MINILNESAKDKLCGRVKFTIEYVQDKDINDERIMFEAGDALEFPFEEAVFDLVVSWDVIEHIPRHTEKQMIKEIERVFSAGGKFYISTPYKCFIGNVLDPAWWLANHFSIIFL